jgi:competence protein ComEA
MEQRNPATSPNATGFVSKTPKVPVTSDGRIDINTATIDVLETIPGIGPAKAATIIEHRMRVGPFRSIHDLDKVSGIGPATLRQIEPHISFGGADAPTPSPDVSTVQAAAPPALGSAPSAAAPLPKAAAKAPSAARAAPALVNINTASYEELCSLPAIGDVKARAIIEYRRTHGGFSDPAQIKNVHGIGQKTYEALRARITVR